MALLALLAGGIVSLLNPAAQFQKSRDTQRKNDLHQIQTALEQYYQDKGKYPLTSGATPVTPCTSSQTYEILNGTACVDWGSSFSPYIQTLPKDPSKGQNYVYYSSDGQSYYLYASLERGANDSNACNSGNPCSTLGTTGFPPTNQCGGGGSSTIQCNYAVTSSNTTP